MPHLQTLQLGGNLLSSSSLSHYNLQHLSYLSSLDLSSNALSGPLHPPALDLFPPNLRHLDLSANSVTSLAASTFSSLTGLTSLTRLACFTLQHVAFGDSVASKSSKAGDVGATGA